MKEYNKKYDRISTVVITVAIIFGLLGLGILTTTSGTANGLRDKVNSCYREMELASRKSEQCIHDIQITDLQSYQLDRLKCEKLKLVPHYCTEKLESNK